MYKPVPTRVDYVRLEREVQAWWDANAIAAKYLRRNQGARERWSFIDGPITANNPMGVHHAWGRTYKDLYNRYWTMRGRKLRYQQGYDGQGLWIEVEVEKEMGFTSKKDIERFGVAEFVEACKQRVLRFAGEITQQSIRLGYWMDWDNSYQTMSAENNYTIWGFLKKCWQKGWLYKGKDTMPWCPRCGTGISQHEIVTEGYQEVTHASVYLKFPITGRANGHMGNRAVGASSARPEALEGREHGLQSGVSPSPSTERGSGGEDESLLVWTTTPWTLAANVAAAVHPDLTYVKVRQGGDVFYVSKGALAAAVRGDYEVLGEVPGSDLVGLTYRGPFDELPAQASVVHRVIAWDEVSDAEGTGVVHIAPGAGAEDFALSKEHGLAVIAPLEEDGTYVAGGGFGFLEGRFAGDVAEAVFESLRGKGLLYRVQDYTHRYPHCWRCDSELVFRLVDEWFISMDGALNDGSSQTLRDKIIGISDKVTWIPEFGKARERDWLRNMHDWMISKKRYYGLALPIYECAACGRFEVIGSETELRERAVEGWGAFEGHSPHRPWVDAVTIACSACGAKVERIKDVGNPWLDAGIVPFSTLDYRHNPDYWREWFPADWVSESFPGQFRNWFYALLAMGTVMVLDTDHEGTPPFKSLFSYALLRDEKGEEMHKSKGNAIWFDEAAERMGADVMRWMFLRHPPANNLNFGWGAGDEIRRGFLSTLWNTYSFFVTYASIDGWQPAVGRLTAAPPGRTVVSTAAPAEAATAESQPTPSGGTGGAAPLTGGMGGVPPTSLTELDRWALSELNQLVAACSHALESYDAMTACRQIEGFIEGLSNWYVRRSRRRFWKSEDDADKRAAYETLWTCLTTLNRLMAPLTPFLADEMYQNLVRSWGASAPESVHLCDWPAVNASLIDAELSSSVHILQRLASLGRSARAKAGIKVRQPLQRVIVRLSTGTGTLLVDIRRMEKELEEELNVKDVKFMPSGLGQDGAGYVTGELNASGLPLMDVDVFDDQVRLNLPLLGQKYGSELGRLQRTFAQADKLRLARRKRAGLPLELDGVPLQPEELLVTTSGKRGYAVAEEAGYAVAVTTEVTPALADEGLARELVRRIQEMRKSAGLEIADRIRLYHEGDADVARVIEAWHAYISQETLAASISAGAGAGYVEEHAIDGRRVRLALERA